MQNFDQASLNQVTNYLFSRREAILNNWRIACEQDPDLGKVSSLSRQEFNNLVPIILDILEQRLLHKPQEAELSYVAQGHGLHRWHKSLGLTECMKELNHLSGLLYKELETYEQLFPEADTSVLLHIHRNINTVMQETLTGSVLKYDELQRLHAAGRLNRLEGALESINEMVQTRGEMLRKSSHDLKGSVGIASSAASLLLMQGLSDEERKTYLEMLSRNIRNVQSMLTELMDLARLESGQESLQIEWLDVSQLLRTLVDGAQGLAQQQNVLLRSDGPEKLMVETDRVKFHRIAQNLLVNALKYSDSSTEKKAIVSVSWSSEGRHQWIFSVQDSGPGMPDSISGTFANQLKPSVEPTALLSPDEAEPDSVMPVNIPEIPTDEEIGRMIDSPKKGEGVGLQIVKHLCDMLGANLDIESQKGRGTLFRIRSLIHFEKNNNE